MEAAVLVARSGKSRTPGSGGRRRWRSSSVDMDVKTPAAIPTAAMFSRSYSTTAAMFSRSYSTTAAVSAAAVHGGGGGGHQAARVVVGEVDGGGREHKRLGAGARLSRKIKEQRARFYIFRRCVSMLICWHEDADE
nr:unnamed protein product [Digitaria exilis]